MAKQAQNPNLSEYKPLRLYHIDKNSYEKMDGKLARNGRETVNYNSDNETESPRLISSSGSPTKRSASNFDIKASREMVKESHTSAKFIKGKKKAKDKEQLDNAVLTEA